jgi:hypothetical protein
MRHAFYVTVTVSLLTLAVIPMLHCEDPGPPTVPEAQGAVDEAMVRLRVLQGRCWSIRLDWHHSEGWTCMTKEDTGGLASKTVRVEAPTLLEVLTKAEDGQ